MEKLLIPENDLQELWELNGRVKAVLAWTESDPYITKNVLTAMLGAPVQTDGVGQTCAEGTEGADDVKEAAHGDGMCERGAGV